MSWRDASALAVVAALEEGRPDALDPDGLEGHWALLAGLARETSPLPPGGALEFLRALETEWLSLNGVPPRSELEEDFWQVQQQLNGAGASEYMRRAAALAQPRRESSPEAPGDEEAFWSARPELTHLRTFARARLASPWAVLGIALARVVAATPPTLTLPAIVGGRASLNLAVAIVGRSGSGKGAAEAAAREALSLGVRLGTFAEHRLGTGQGIAHAYASRDKKGEIERIADAALLRVDEVDHIGGHAGQRGATILSELRSALMGEALGSLYADRQKRLEIDAHTYRCALTVGVQPARAGVLLDDTDGGTPQRFVWVPAIDPDAPDEPPAEPNPWVWQPPHWPREIAVCDQARDEIIAARRAELRGEGQPLDGHRLLLKEKIAAALELLAGRAEITTDGWALADHLMRTSDKTRETCSAALTEKARAANVARGRQEGERAVVADEARTEAATQRVARTITRTLDRKGPMAAGELRRALCSTDRQHFQTAIDRLEDAGQITSEDSPRGQRWRHA